MTLQLSAQALAILSLLAILRMVDSRGGGGGLSAPSSSVVGAFASASGRRFLEAPVPLRNGLSRRRKRRSGPKMNANTPELVFTCTVLGGRRANDDGHDDGYGGANQSRRELLLRLAGGCVTSTVVACGRPPASGAACLAGDTSADCIGVYKVPIDERVKQYVETPEKLKLFAPDVRWVPPVEYPKSYGDAIADLKRSRERCAALSGVVMGGDLESAGMELLAVSPRVTVAGRVVLGSLNGAAAKAEAEVASASALRPKGGGRDGPPSGNDLSMRAYRAEVALTDLEVLLGQCDVLIGQGLRGQLGVSAPAQIQILSLVGEVNSCFDEVLRALPESLKG